MCGTIGSMTDPSVPRRGDRPTRVPVVPSVGVLAQIRQALDEAEGRDPELALPYLREAADRLTQLIDEAMATAVLHGQASLRAAGAQAGLTENAVGPRLARTHSLAAYADERGRVTASAVARARYDLENGQPRQPTEHLESLRFKSRRAPG